MPWERRQPAEREGGQYDEDGGHSGRFYDALVGLSGRGDPAKTYRRRTMGVLQSIAARLRARTSASAGTTGHHASVNYILGLLLLANPEHRIKAREVQRGLGYTAGGVTRRLDAMVRDGLLVRLPDPEDGRAWLAQLTPAGVALAQTLVGQVDERSKRLEAAFTVAEWQTLHTLLERLDRALE